MYLNNLFACISFVTINNYVSNPMSFYRKDSRPKFETTYLSMQKDNDRLCRLCYRLDPLPDTLYLYRNITPVEVVVIMSSSIIDLDGKKQLTNSMLPFVMKHGSFGHGNVYSESEQRRTSVFWKWQVGSMLYVCATLWYSFMAELWDAASRWEVSGDATLPELSFCIKVILYQDDGFVSYDYVHV